MVSQRRQGRSAKARAEAILEGHQRLREGFTTGRCMWPFLPSGVRAVPSDRLPEVGSVAVYRSGGAIRAHRVVAVFDGGVLTRPDQPGAGLERVMAAQLLGVLERGAGIRNVFLKPAVGSLVARMGLALSEPAPFRALQGIRRRLPSIRPLSFDVGVYLGDAAGLALALSQAGLNPRVPSLEAMEEAYLQDRGGFAVLARSGARFFGAIALLPVPKEPSRAHLFISLRRHRRRPEILDALLWVALDEAADRGFEAVEAEAREAAGEGRDGLLVDGGMEAVALRRHGFVCIEREHRRVPATGQRVVLYRWGERGGRRE